MILPSIYYEKIAFSAEGSPPGAVSRGPRNNARYRAELVSNLVQTASHGRLSFLSPQVIPCLRQP